MYRDDFSMPNMIAMAAKAAIFTVSVVNEAIFLLILQVFVNFN